MNFKKINFKDKKYVIPLIILPVLLFFIYLGSSFMKEKEPEIDQSEKLTLSLGDTRDSIMTKNEAYDAFFDKTDDRTMLEGLDPESDSLMVYGDLLTDNEKKRIDSIRYNNQNRMKSISNKNNSSYYNPNQDQKDYQRSAEIIRMLNENSYTSKSKNTPAESYSQENQTDPVKLLKEQMLIMDSIEKARDPEYQSRLAAEEKLKSNKAKKDAFLNSTFNVMKSDVSSSFNSIYRTKENNFIKAVIDEDTKGYLGSRIRIRLLEDIYVAKKRIKKGSILYAQVSAFSMQRVNLNIVSVLADGEILPINLSIYDLDGMQGLFIPNSLFRDMVKEMGSQSVQGTNLDINGSSFFTSIGSKLFTSTSQSIANIIKTNKAKLKYNSYVYLIDEKELKTN
ncbi:conjugative transposon protein TraM [Empedobacter stercoris]|uniref:conjugative transposon protein TraM n=1 Tax=Empedobacter stercoris TaxID=1628248 RepID=UPI0021AEAD34|nr:conjugative transposon protein TraM [Empedobacter stercoris]UWX66189.1 conjugative transposon protein TraM [Empedobacter stercoris]